ncbi:MAG: hypothetical protein R3B40_11460 [Polyangiales bacterium]|nr:hypothetical protein [Myxococcales bacterium]MCB9657206.1 hypothetical protein [Sandaracinaceae bacterium]
MPLPSLLCFVFAAGVALALAGRSEIRVSPRPVLLTTSAMALVLYATLLVVPVGIYFYVLYGDWFLLYTVDVQRIPSALALVGFVILVGVGLLGFAAGASLARAQRDAVSGALLVASLVATAALALGWRERLSVVGTYAQFTRGFGLTDFTAGSLLPSAWVMTIILAVGLLATVGRVLWGRRRG